LKTSVATQIFEPKQARLKKDDPGYDEDYISSYIFQQSLIPIGKMRLRQQRRSTIECEGDNIAI
jgi:hypothetical protein